MRAAERSSDLWATVNECNVATHHPRGSKLVGVRVQIPALGFMSRLYMGVQIQYWSADQKRYRSTGASYGPASIGRATHGVHQGGVVFPFQAPASGSKFVLRGVATLEWRIGSRVLGRVTRNTSQGFSHVDHSRPPGYNASTCTLTP